MDRRWQWAPGLDPHLRNVLAHTFTADALAPVQAAPRRSVAGRTYGLLPTRPALPFDVFVKAFHYESWRHRLRDRFGRSGAAREFDAAVRLHAEGLPVARPLALVREPDPRRGIFCYLLMEHLGPGAALSQALAEASAGGAGRAGDLVAAVARLLADVAAARVWFRDTNPANFHVAWLAGGGPVRIGLVDARHTRFGADPAEALAGMLTMLGGFLYRDAADPGAVAALIEAVSAEARSRGGSLAGFRPDRVADEAKRMGAALVARTVRKGHRPAEDLSRFAQRYDTPREAANYRDRRFGRSQHGRTVDAAERRIVGETLDRLGIRGPVLDVPCGTGRFVAVFARAGCDVLAGDVSADMLALARRAAAEAGGVCRCVALDARRLPVPDRSMEMAFAMRLLHRVRDPAERVAVLKELGRVSRRWVLFSFYNRRSGRGLRDRMRGRYPGETRSAIRRDAAEAGLRVERFLPVGFLARQTLVLCSVEQATNRS